MSHVKRLRVPGGCGEKCFVYLVYTIHKMSCISRLVVALLNVFVCIEFIFCIKIIIIIFYAFPCVIYFFIYYASLYALFFYSDYL